MSICPRDEIVPEQLQGRSGSIVNPTHWWYLVREEMMLSVFAPHVRPGTEALEVGSADGASTAWLRERTHRIATDLDPAGLQPGDVCASVEQLPFAADEFDVVGAFDVIEHLPDPQTALAEIARVLDPGGRLLVSVPAYQWAWTDFDVRAGHYRRYTRRRLREDLERAGLDVVRVTHAFAATFPFFALDRLRARLTRGSATDVAAGNPSALVVRALRLLGRLDAALLRRVDLPFGSSVFAVARRQG